MQIIELAIDVHSDRVKTKYLQVVAGFTSTSRVDVDSDRVKTKYPQVVAGFTGIDQVKVDQETRTLTIVGDVDRVLVIKNIRKAKMPAQTIGVGHAIRRYVPQHQHKVQQYSNQNSYPHPYCYYPPIVTGVAYGDHYDTAGRCNIF